MPTPIDELQEQAQNQNGNLADNITELLDENQEMGYTNRELADELGSSRQVVSSVTKELRRDGQINFVKIGRAFHYFSSDTDVDLAQEWTDNQNNEQDTSDEPETQTTAA